MKQTPSQEHGPLHRYTPLHASDEPYPATVLERLDADADQIIARYPREASALMPLLHLVQSIDGYVSGRGVDWCAGRLGLTHAEVAGVATFYTQYKRHPNGEYTVGVCTNTLCAVMGGDQIFDEVSDHLGIGHDETTPDGLVTLERVECNAACDFAPVVMVNWEFFDNQTPESATQLVDELRAGKDVAPTRGASRVCSFRHTARLLAGFPDGLADEGIGAGPASIAGLKVAHDRGWSAPGTDGGPQDEATTTTSPHDAVSADGDTGGAQVGDAQPRTGQEHSSAGLPTGDTDKLPGENANTPDDLGEGGVGS